MLILLSCSPAIAVEPEIDAGLQQSLEGDAGLDAETMTGDAAIEIGTDVPPVKTLGIDDEVLQRPIDIQHEDFVPALLTVERRRQFTTACEYWVKLENRLPFKIRNLALRFTTYLKNDSYDREVVFDSEVRSFSELRPTDSQYRNIFVGHVDCADLRYIKVEDAGRCSMGELTKFSAESGDCAKYVEVQPSELICIYLDDGSFDSDVSGPMAGGHTKRNPCGIVTQYDIDRLLTRMIQSYKEGDSEGLAALFSKQVETSDGKGLEALENAFPELLEPREGSSLRLGNVSWKPRSGGFASIWLTFRLDMNRGDGGAEEKTMRAAMRALMRDGQLVISHFFHEER